MKLVFHFCKIFFFFLFVFYLLPSYNAATKTKGVTTTQAFRKGVITITGGDPSTGKLTMTDDSGHAAHNFHADHGQVIMWILHPNPDVEEILDITQKDTTENYNIFSDLPIAIGGSKNWKATIDSNTDNPFEWYNIIWKDKGGKERIYDPLIQVKPKLPPQ
jgi:hypothetical protein